MRHGGGAHTAVKCRWSARPIKRAYYFAAQAGACGRGAGGPRSAAQPRQRVGTTWPCAPLSDERPATNLGLTVANLSLLKSIRLADDGAFHLVGEAAVDAGSGLCGKER